MVRGLGEVALRVNNLDVMPIFLVEDRIPPATMNALRAKGYEIRPIERSGAVNGIVIDPATGFRLCGADRERTATLSAGD